MDDFTKLLMDLHKNHGKTETREDYIRSPLGWPGGKSRSLKNIIPLLPYRKTWVDVFGGSGIVTLARKESPLEIYNDRYSGVVAFYRVLKDRAKMEKLRERLDFTVFSREEFMWCKDTWQICTDDVERAARWYYMHQASFGKQEDHYGRVRAGKGDAFSRMKGHLPEFYDAHIRFQNVFLENMDWRLVLTDYDSPETVFYLDPPFVKCTKNHYKGERLVMMDHEEILERSMNCQGFVAISGFEDEVYRNAGFDAVHSWEVYHSINGVGMVDQDEEYGGREKRIECLYIKEAA